MNISFSYNAQLQIKSKFNFNLISDNPPKYEDAEKGNEIAEDDQQDQNGQKYLRFD